MDTNGAEIRFEGSGEVIRQLRTDAGINLRELADRIDFSFSALSKIENNERSLSLSLIERIAQAVEVPPENIILKCLEFRFPKLKETRAGAIVARYLTAGGQ